MKPSYHGDNRRTLQKDWIRNNNLSRLDFQIDLGVNSIPLRPLQ